MTRPTGGGRYLTSLRETAGLDLETAAARAGIKAMRLMAVERDEEAPRFLEVLRLARAYERSLEEIATGWRAATQRVQVKHFGDGGFDEEA